MDHDLIDSYKAEGYELIHRKFNIQIIRDRYLDVLTGNVVPEQKVIKAVAL
jgi:hypothetical protein